jgi:hypothetical protein
VFESRVLKKISDPKMEKVAGYWRRLYNEEFMICTFHQTSLK